MMAEIMSDSSTTFSSHNTSPESTDHADNSVDFLDSSGVSIDESEDSQPSAGDITPAAHRKKIPISEIPWECRATETEIRWDRVVDGEPLFLDDEFQGYKDTNDPDNPNPKFKHRHGRVAVINTAGQTVVDWYLAYPRMPGIIKNCPPKRFGVEPMDLLLKNGAVPARKAERQLKRLLKNRTIVLHDKRADTKAFYYETDAFSPSNGVTIVDTQDLYSYLRPCSGRPGLRYAYEMIFGEQIQAGGIHSPVEDAKATMRLYLEKCPYDRAAEEFKVKAKKAKNDNGSFVPHQMASKEPSLEDYIKVKPAQGKSKRGKKMAAALNQNNGNQTTGATTQALQPTTFKKNTLLPSNDKRALSAREAPASVVYDASSLPSLGR